MAICLSQHAHPALKSLARLPRLRFFELRDHHEAYGAGAWAEHPDCMELHLELFRFGPATVRTMRADLAEFKAMALALGKRRIVGLRTEDGMAVDSRWPRFTKLFGFTGQRVFQAAELELD
ncbi:hypothetical protein SAMN04488503_1617 [Humidesulfovibrio mexicanus]|uniref:Uncharacterized protein n=1 Tax=Humidesulfovibrio mexicanus TaxID=147047 RepID=A0A238ZUG2_9BACT|nr:hypothetical protein [Humidesulfovibrio mexicanus]SNR86975.1 hypothetical protein SAMN04488503_1617 [Humidesulfovibrio mexicanus]